MKCNRDKDKESNVKSCPSRGTWIEIIRFLAKVANMLKVVPLAGHVD